jgi:hypothetical protein
MPLPDAAKAVLPGGGQGSGSSHAFAVPVISTTHGAGLPLDTEMKLRIVCPPDANNNFCDDDAERIASGEITCSVCHDQHSATSAIGGTPHVSQPQKVTGTDLGGTGTVSASGVYTGSEGAWFHIKITATGPTPPNFQWRSFNDTTGWTAFSGDTNLGTDIALADGVTVSFDAGSFVADEEFELFASFPFLRVSTVNPVGAHGSFICMQCHRGRDSRLRSGWSRRGR